jgi:DNA-binding NarL/FixJ family response regulator
MGLGRRPRHPVRMIRSAGRCAVIVDHAGSTGDSRRVVRTPLRIALADDSFLVREAITHVLADAPGVEVVATCEDGDALRAAVEAELPDVVLTDIRMPPSGDDEGIVIANALRESHPEMGVVVVSQYADPRYGIALLEGGSDGRAYLLKERLHDCAQLVTALETVAAGGSVVDSRVVEALIAARARADGSPLMELTPRELEILSEIAQGKSNLAIAEELVLGKRAVEKHINAIFFKLGLTQARDLSRRVKAALIYVAQRADVPAATP